MRKFKEVITKELKELETDPCYVRDFAGTSGHIFVFHVNEYSTGYDDVLSMVLKQHGISVTRSYMYPFSSSHFEVVLWLSRD